MKENFTQSLKQISIFHIQIEFQSRNFENNMIKKLREVESERVKQVKSSQQPIDSSSRQNIEDKNEKRN